jgi:hypothetical protein
MKSVLLISAILTVTVTSCNPKSTAVVTQDQQQTANENDTGKCKFTCFADQVPESTNIVVCETCDNGDVPFCNELDEEQAVGFCSDTPAGSDASSI